MHLGLDRDEQKILREKREAQKLQIRRELEQQIAERQNAREEERKRQEQTGEIPAGGWKSRTKHLSDVGLVGDRAVTPLPGPICESVLLAPAVLEVKPQAEENSIAQSKPEATIPKPGESCTNQVREPAKDDSRWDLLKSKIEVYSRTDGYIVEPEQGEARAAEAVGEQGPDYQHS